MKLFYKHQTKRIKIKFFDSGGDGNFKISSSCVGYIDSVGGCLPFCTDGYTMIYCFASKG